MPRALHASQSSILIDKCFHINVAAFQNFFDDVEKWSLKRLRSTAYNATGSSPPPLLRYLKQHGLSVVAFAEQLVGYWTHGTPSINTSVQVDTWLGQFDQIGCVWLGERLLRVLEVINASQLADDLCLSTVIHPDDACCVLSDPKRKGKSAEVIANLLSKRFPTVKIGGEPAHLIEQMTTGTLHIFEDGLFTGTEIMGVLESLLNERVPLKKRNKVRPLSRPTLLKDRDIMLHFARACDYGQKILSSYLTFRDLNNITVNIPPYGEISIISDNGETALAYSSSSNLSFLNPAATIASRAGSLRYAPVRAGLDRTGFLS